MEDSPLRFLDYDVSLMLADQVRQSQGEASRRFHYNLYSYESLFKSTIPGYHYRDHNIICRVFLGLVRWWDDRFPDSDILSATAVQQRINLYEQELKVPTELRPFEKYSWE
jgi:hypothetical protein